MSFLHNLKRDALNTVRGLEPQNLLQTFLHPGRTIGGMADFYSQLAHHPIGTFEQAPLSTALGFAPGVGPLAKLARLRMVGGAGALSAADIAGLEASILKSPTSTFGDFSGVLKSPVDVTFAGVSKAPDTTWTHPLETYIRRQRELDPGATVMGGENFPHAPNDTYIFGESGDADFTQLDQNYVAKNLAKWLDPTNLTNSTKSWKSLLKNEGSLLPEGPFSSAEHGPTNPYDIYDVANTADYINPDAPDMNLMLDAHEAAMAKDASYMDWANSMPESQGEYPAGPDYAHLGPEDFQALGLNDPLPPELEQFLRPHGLSSEYTRDPGGWANMDLLSHSTGAGIMPLLRAMRNDAQPSIQQRLLTMLMQQYSGN